MFVQVAPLSVVLKMYPCACVPVGNPENVAYAVAGLTASTLI